MPQRLLNGNEIHAPLMIVGSAGPAQRVRAEALTGRPALVCIRYRSRLRIVPRCRARPDWQTNRTPKSASISTASRDSETGETP